MADYSQGAAPSSPFGAAAFGLRTDTAADLSAANAALGTLQLDSAGALRTTHEGGKLTYIANSQFACDSTATDIWYLPGQATKVVKVLWLAFSSVATAAATGRVALILRSTANTAGTALASTLALMDQRNAAPASAPKHYTAHPTALGTSLNNVWSQQYGQQAVSSVPIAVAFIDFRPLFGSQGLRLSGTAQILALNAAAALGGAGNLWDVNCCITEEATSA